MKLKKTVSLLSILVMLMTICGGIGVTADEMSEFVVSVEFTEAFGDASSEDISTVYVSASGSDQNSGASSDAPLATFAKAYEKGATNIIIVGSAVYSEAPSEYEGTVTVTGLTADATLSLPGTVSIKGNLTINI